jgi:hypothetical protein
MRNIANIFMSITKPTILLFKQFLENLKKAKTIDTAPLSSIISLENRHKNVDCAVLPDTITTRNSKEETSVAWIKTGSSWSKTDGSQINEKEVPYLMGISLIEKVNTANEYACGKRNIFEDNKLSHEENVFFRNCFEVFEEKGINPNRIMLTRLSDGTFNVDYGNVCYIGKIRFKTIPEKYVVIKENAKRPSKVFFSMYEAEAWVKNRSEYTIRDIASYTDNYMQYRIGLKDNEDMINPSLSESIRALYRWANYVNYCLKL